MPDQEIVINVKGLSKAFNVKNRTSKNKTVEAIRSVSFTVSQGEKVAYLGPNGAGKSTSVKILTGILYPTDGEVSVLGLTPWKQRKKLAFSIGVLFGQRSQLWQDLTPRQSYRLLGAIYKIPKKDLEKRIEETAELVDASDLLDEPSKTHSLGQRMKCELAASLLHRPKILFLDEPTIGLDLIAKQRFRELLNRLNAERKTTIMLTSHDIPDIEAVADRVIIINHGVVLYDDKTDNLTSSSSLEDAITKIYKQEKKV